MSVGQIMIFVSTLKLAKAFYVDLLGLEIAHDMSEEGMLIMKNEGAYLTIHEGYSSVQIPKDQCRVVPIFKVLNIEKTRGILASNGIYLYGEITDTPVHRYQMAKDLDGNWIEVAQFKS